LFQTFFNYLVIRLGESAKPTLGKEPVLGKLAKPTLAIQAPFNPSLLVSLAIRRAN